MPEKKTSPVRHAVARSTGATTWTRKDGSEWKIDCLNHVSATAAPNRAKAWVTGSHPQDWCSKCKTIANGKAAKIAEGRLDLPTPKKKAAATRRPAKTTQPAKPEADA